MASASLWGPLEGIYLDRNTVNVSPKQAQKVRLPIGQLGTLTWAHSKDLSHSEQLSAPSMKLAVGAGAWHRSILLGQSCFPLACFVVVADNNCQL